MHIVVAASDEQWNELTALRPNINWQRVDAAADFDRYKNSDAFFSLHNNDILAEFDNVSGLEKGASVEIAGVPVGDVADISLKDPVAVVTLRLYQGVELRDDDIAAIRTKGIIGDRYVKISRGGSTKMIKQGERMTETESVVDIEDIIGKIVHSITGEKSKDSAKDGKE